MTVSIDITSDTEHTVGRAIRRPAWDQRSFDWIISTLPKRGGNPTPLRGVVAALSQAIAAKDPDTLAHSNRVRALSEAMARELGLPRAMVCEIGVAAELHDVGKIGVSDQLLHKAGPLTPEERRRILDHTLIGERILLPVLGGRPVVLAVVRWHHEHTDGGGYPDRLRGEAIPLAARIVAVADAFDAMTSTRPYRAAFSRGTAIRELGRCAGTQFDVRCVHALLRTLRRSAVRSRTWSTGAHRFVRFSWCKPGNALFAAGRARCPTL